MDLDNLNGYYILNNIKPFYAKLTFPYQLVTEDNFVTTHNRLEILIKEEEVLLYDKSAKFNRYKGGDDSDQNMIIIYEY